VSALEIVEAVFTIVGTLTIVLCCFGLLIGDVFDRLHFLGPATVFAPWLLLVAVVLRFASTESVVKMTLLVFAVMLTSPVLTHGTAKTIRLERRERDRSSEAR
jgi:monovalent cation/proton antiporter MnhG/PhaG subunit